MSPNDTLRDIIVRKLTTMASYLDELKKYLSEAAANELPTRVAQRLVERMAQLVIECAVDTNQLLLDLLGAPPAGSARESFAELQLRGVLDDYLARGFQQTYVGMRNRIIHDYERLDSRIVFHTSRRLLDDGEAYINTVFLWLEKRPSPRISGSN